MEPEDMVPEPEDMTGVMGWSQRIRVRVRGYDRSYGVEPESMVSESEDMTGVMGWSQRLWCKTCKSQRLWCKSQRLWCKSQRLWYPYDFSVSPSPLGTNWVLELIETWLGLGLEVFGTKGFGTGLDNICK